MTQRRILPYSFRELQHPPVIYPNSPHLLHISTMLITSLPVDIKIHIVTCLGSWYTVKAFLEAIPSMKPLLGAYSSSIANSVPRLPYKQRQFEQLMNTIIAAHFSKPLHTADEMKSFMDYHFPDQKTPGTLRRPAFPRDIESINYLIAVRLALEYFWYCVQDVYSSNEIPWVVSAFLRLQLHTELFYPSTDNSDIELPEMLNIFWSKFSESDKDSCGHVYGAITTIIELLLYNSYKRVRRNFFKFPDALSQHLGISRLAVLGSRRTRDWKSADGEFVCSRGLYDDKIDVHGEQQLCMVENMYECWCKTECRTEFSKKCLDNFEQCGGEWSRYID